MLHLIQNRMGLRWFLTLAAIISSYQVASFSFQGTKLRTSSLRAENTASESKTDLIRPSNAESIKVIYESENVLAIDKPPHISHHDDPEYMGILSCVRALQEEDAIEYKGRLWGVHRLDRVTSGILIFAKSQEVAKELTIAFREKKVIKYYVALTNKKPKKKKQGWVKGDMLPSRRKTWKLSNTSENPAVTRFFTAGLGNCDFNDWAWSSDLDVHAVGTDTANLLPKTMILFRPHTGKTHQLRVAAKSLGTPILGDLTYSDATEAKCMQRAYLHSLALSVVIKDETISIYNPPKQWFQDDSIDNQNCNGMGDILKSLMNKQCDDVGLLGQVNDIDTQ
jgi:tRNA pseudouridine32 synthase/23S rRNA pseudouridine746 synthase